MINELKNIIDNADSVSVLLTKPAEGSDQYTATLLVKGSTPAVPPLQVQGTIEELDDAVGQAFNEAAEVLAECSADIEAFKAAAKKGVEDAKDSAKPPAKTAAKKTAKKAAKKPEPAASKPDADEPSIFGEDDATKAAMAKLGL